MPRLRDYFNTGRESALEAAESYSPGAPLDEQIEAFRVFCLALKMVAYGYLLVEANTDAFFLNLHRVAANGHRLLQLAWKQQHNADAVPASANDPLLAAIPTDATLASHIATLSKRALTPPEYDDEFWAALFFQDAVLGRPAKALESSAEKIDAYLEEETPRTTAFRALARRDAKAFGAAFAAWNAVAAEQLDATAGSGGTYSSGITRHVWLEGLAFIALAEARGLTLPVKQRPKLPLQLLAAKRPPPPPEPMILGVTDVTAEML